MIELRRLLELTNETLAAALVVVSASLMLYNLTRNLYNRVARTSAIVLACITTIYVTDVLISLGPGVGSFEALLRFQWVGLAIIPAAVFHVSDALLATTGLPSRGRRRRIVRVSYVIAVAFLLLAAFTDSMVKPVVYDGDKVSLQDATFFSVYILYFMSLNLIAALNVGRARDRCLTRSNQRRMSYLQFAMVMLTIGIFPYAVLLPPGTEFTLPVLLLVNAANVMVMLMLLFMAYPLSFFGSEIPDRVVKAELLRFMLRGPATGMLGLIVILFTDPTSDMLGVPGQTFMPFAVVAVVLLWQWALDVALPWLERRLIYSDEDDTQLEKLEELSTRLLTRSDLMQLVEANLEATVDFLQARAAFLAALPDNTPEFIKSVGPINLTSDALQNGIEELVAAFKNDGEFFRPYLWERYWTIPLYSSRKQSSDGQSTLIGIMAIDVNEEQLNSPQDETEMLKTFVYRAERTLDDMLLQQEVYAALEGLLPQISITRGRAAEVEYRAGREAAPRTYGLPSRDQVIEQVHAALRHYWGGPGLSSSRLLELAVVREQLAENENNPVRALRSVIQQAIDNQAPEGERDMKRPEWTLYNILTLRFVEKRKVRETARRLYMSEANLYRKQNTAIEAVADTIIEMERETLNGKVESR